MPIHLNYQGTLCKNCYMEFVAYKKDCECPFCRQPTADYFDFKTATVATMKDHKQLYGKYFPEAWFSDSTADLVQGIIFELFDNIEVERPKDVLKFINEQLEAVEWEEGREYLAKQIKEIVAEIYEIYQKDPDFCEGKLKDKPINPKLKEIVKTSVDIPIDIDSQLGIW